MNDLLWQGSGRCLARPGIWEKSGLTRLGKDVIIVPTTSHMPPSACLCTAWPAPHLMIISEPIEKLIVHADRSCQIPSVCWKMILERISSSRKSDGNLRPIIVGERIILGSGQQMHCILQDSAFAVFVPEKYPSISKLHCRLEGPIYHTVLETSSHEIWLRALKQALNGRSLVLPLYLTPEWLQAHTLLKLPPITLFVSSSSHADAHIGSVVSQTDMIALDYSLMMTNQTTTSTVTKPGATLQFLSLEEGMQESLENSILSGSFCRDMDTDGEKKDEKQQYYQCHQNVEQISLYKAPKQQSRRLAGLGDSLEALCTVAPQGILLHGPPGCGKTLLVAEAARICRAGLSVIQTQDIQGSFLGETEANLRGIFAEAQKKASYHPHILFIDEIDALCQRRDNTSTHNSRAVAQLLTLMDGIASRGSLVVVAATNQPDALDPALRRPGRFDREVYISPPSVRQRTEIFRLYIECLPAIGFDIDYEALASSAIGFVGADISAACRLAATQALKQYATTGKFVPIMQKDVLNAIRSTIPTVRRSDQISITPVTFDDIGGLEDVKQKLIKIVEWPLQYVKLFNTLNIKPARGVLLYGPPGCCKTTLACAIATTCKASFYSLSGAQIYSPYVGDSEKAIRDVFDRARKSSPSVIFFDEVDAIVGKRQGADSARTVDARVLSMVLNEMDGIQAAGRVLVVAATNRPDLLDTAFIRAGRIDHLIYIPHPDKNARKSILKVYTRHLPMAQNISLEHIAEVTEYYTGAEAAMKTVHRDPEAPLVTVDDFETALDHVKPSLSKAKIEYYKSLAPTIKKLS